MPPTPTDPRDALLLRALVSGATLPDAARVTDVDDAFVGDKLVDHAFHALLIETEQANEAAEAARSAASAGLT